MGNIVSPIDVFVKTNSLSFWWGVHDLEKQYWEDIWIYYKNRKNSERYTTTITTKGFFRELDKQANESGYWSEFSKEQLKENLDWLGLSIEELLNKNEIIYGYCYSDYLIGHPDFYEVPFNAPRDKKRGIKPSYIEIINPTEEMSISVVKESVQVFCRDFLGIPLTKVFIIQKPKRSYVIKTLKEERKEEEERRKYVESGGKIEIRMLPKFIEDLYGSDIFDKIERENVDYGFYQGDAIYIKLKDGTERFLIQDFKVIE